MENLTRFEKSALVLLIGSGCLHLLLWTLGTESWDSPISLRKPALFGISAGLTLWSCLWVFTQFGHGSPRVGLRRLLTGSLTLEVALITLQAWRGRPSHFNRQTPLDATIETALLVLITIATLVVFWLTAASFQKRRLISLPQHFRLAAQAGLVLLCSSCLLGFLITWIGNQLAIEGLSPETYPPRGVLKFPHGAALHAIQTLVVLAWLATRWKTPWPVAVVWSAIIAHVIGLLFAAYQTFQGRGRFELDWLGGGLLTAAVAAFLLSCGLLVWPRSPGRADSTTTPPSTTRNAIKTSA